MGLYIGIDLGTSAMKLLLMDSDGMIQNVVQKEYPLEFPQENIAALMKMAVDYGRSNGFKGDFYIEPKPKEPMKHQYDFDAATAIGFLRQYGLDKDFRLNIEANHATLAGHTFQHDLRISAINGMLGSIDANQGDYLLGWAWMHLLWDCSRRQKS